jgi:hypothetical protein
MRILLFAGLVISVAACTAKAHDTGSSSGGPGSPSGPPTGQTTCTPSIDGGTNKLVTDLALPGPPCPAGYAAAPHEHAAGTAYAPDVGPVRTFHTEADLVASNLCVRSGDAGAADPDAGSAFDYATHDVVAVTFLAYASKTAPPLADVGGDLWALRNVTWCSAEQPKATDWFYAVPKDMTVQAQDCKTSCNIRPGI